MGYTFFDIPRLTHQEINILINSENERLREEERQQRKSSLQNRRR